MIIPAEMGEWSMQGACKGHTDLFFPAHGETTAERLAREPNALRICAACPVIEPCRAWARANRERGIWGGETQEARSAAGITPVGSDDHLNRARRRAAERALSHLTLDELEALTRPTRPEGDPRP